MQAFVDLQGASGTSYRYRHCPNGEVTTPMAGNYALIAPDGGKVVAVGSANDLMLASAEWRRARTKLSDVELFMRLNVSSAARDSEQQDIARHYKLRSKQLTA